MSRRPGISNAVYSRIKAVAKLRVEGATWAQIAMRFRYKHADSARISLTQKYPELWREEFEIARALYLDEIEAEAILTQRELIRPTRKEKRTSIDPETGERKTVESEIPVPLDIRQRSAHSLLAHSRQLRAKKIELRGGLTTKHTSEVDIDARIALYADALDGEGEEPDPGEAPEEQAEEPEGGSNEHGD